MSFKVEIKMSFADYHWMDQESEKEKLLAKSRNLSFYKERDTKVLDWMTVVSRNLKAIISNQRWSRLKQTYRHKTKVGHGYFGETVLEGFKNL